MLFFSSKFLDGLLEAASGELLLVKATKCPSENEFSTLGLRSFRRLPELLFSLCLVSIDDESVNAVCDVLFDADGALGWALGWALDRLMFASSRGWPGCCSG